jgi:hypothetical protein
MNEGKRSKLRRLLLHGEPETKKPEAYKPKTEFLKQKMAEARLGKKTRGYIDALCEIEAKVYKEEVLHQGPGFYGSYEFLHPERYGAYKTEYFAMLKELRDSPHSAKRSQKITGSCGSCEKP